MGVMRLGVTTKGGDIGAGTTKGVDIGAGEIAMGEMRPGVTTKGVDNGAMGVMRQRRVVVPCQVCHPPQHSVEGVGRMGGRRVRGSQCLANPADTCLLLSLCVRPWQDHGGGVAVPRQASVSDGGRHSVDGVGRAVQAPTLCQSLRRSWSCLSLVQLREGYNVALIMLYLSELSRLTHRH
ncbi:unnamed protein product, partial [Boreogadus saida]